MAILKSQKKITISPFICVVCLIIKIELIDMVQSYRRHSILEYFLPDGLEMGSLARSISKALFISRILVRSRSQAVFLYSVKMPIEADLIGRPVIIVRMKMVFAHHSNRLAHSSEMGCLAAMIRCVDFSTLSECNSRLLLQSEPRRE